MHQPSILHRAWAEIDLSALENNVRCIQEILPEHIIEITIEKNLEKGFDYRKITVTGLPE